jgi:SnoaL-like protein
MQDRLLVVAPWLWAWTWRLGGHLRVDSRVRRVFISASIRSGWGAFNRRDLQLMFVRYAPDLEFVAPAGLQSLGVSGVRGPDAGRRYINATAEAWQHWQLAPEGFIDLGNRVLTFGTQRAEGGTSHAPIEDPYAQLLELDNEGLIVRQSDFHDWDAALQAAGLRRDQVLGFEALAMPQRD